MAKDGYAAFAREVQYTPPPDATTVSTPLPASSSRPSWFPSHANTTSSYQAGGVPTWGDSYGGGGLAEEGASAINEWETRFGWRVDIEAAVAWLLGPISALLLLVIETKNDYIRFHAYQSGIYSTVGIVLDILFHWMFPKWLWIILLVAWLLSIVYFAARAYQDANSSAVGQGGIVRYHLPYIGEYADRWVGEE